ncbi:MAG: quinone oxidoreductase family protein [Candidatus Cyclobacteriaceae bacterium M3_2C_046]
MNAIQVAQNGGIDVLQLQTLEDPQPAENEVIIENKAIGVNFIDIYHRTGLYPKNLPFIPGLEGAGVIRETGKNASNWKPGDRVAYAGITGAYAELIKAPKDRIVAIPAEVNFEIAAAVMLQGMTAHYLSRSTFVLNDQHTCLIHAAAGGVGLLLTQMAKIAGARVLGTVSTPEKASLANSAGADHVIMYTRQDFEEQVKEITKGKGLEVVYDSVGKTTFEKSLNCLAPLGYMVLFGQSSGPVPPFDPSILNQKGSLFLTRPSLFHYINNWKKLKERSGQIFDWILNDHLQVRIGQKLGLKDAAQAHQLLEGRNTTGKTILTI